VPDLPKVSAYERRVRRLERQGKTALTLVEIRAQGSAPWFDEFRRSVVTRRGKARYAKRFSLTSDHSDAVDDRKDERAGLESRAVHGDKPRGCPMTPGGRLVILSGQKTLASDPDFVQPLTLSLAGAPVLPLRAPWLARGPRSRRMRQMQTLNSPTANSPIPRAKITGSASAISIERERVMTGHSKWHTHQAQEGRGRREARQDFHAHHQGIDGRRQEWRRRPDMNPRLRTVIADAKQRQHAGRQHQAGDSRGHGEKKASRYDEVMYEGYGPAASAILIEALTDNKNRTVGEIRHTFTKWGGKLGEPNTVARMFQKKGLIVVEKSKAAEEVLMDAVLEAGADDMNDDGEAWEILCTPDVHPAVWKK
jgi:YebC/PmpR family DNA-binding regulatory protein